MIYSVKSLDLFRNSKELLEIKSKEKQLRSEKKLSKQGVHYHTNHYFKPKMKKKEIIKKVLEESTATTAASEHVIWIIPGTSNDLANTQIPFNSSINAMNKSEKKKQNTTEFKFPVKEKCKI